MEDLLPYFERELVMLRGYGRAFAERYPAMAAQLGGDGGTDPQTERLIQSVALLSARCAKRLDDGYALFTATLLDMLLPHYLRPFPSCAIVRAQGQPGVHITLPRDTALETEAVRGVRCSFRTTAAIDTPQAVLTACRYDPVLAAPMHVSLPAQGCAGLRLELAALASGDAATSTPVRRLRWYIDGEAPLCAAVRDALFLHAVQAWVAPSDAGADPDAWVALPALPLAQAGFAADEALLPPDPRSHPGHLLLAEYFAYPEKFNFVDLDLVAIQARLPPGCRRYTLHVALVGLEVDGHVARMLRHVSASQFLTGCAPAINLFPVHAEPISLTQRATDYAVLAHPNTPAAYEIFTVDRVQLLREHGQLEECRPFYSLRHGEQVQGPVHYWMLRTDEGMAATSPGYEQRLSLLDGDGAALSQEHCTLSLALTCTNRDLPAQVRHSALKSNQAAIAAWRLVRMPSPVRRQPAEAGLQWRLLSHLALNQHGLVQQGLPALRELLALYDVQRSATSQRQIAAITGLQQAPATTWLRHARGASLAHGVQVRLTLDETAFAGTGLQLFIDVLDCFLGLYVQVNSFIELVVLSAATGKEIKRCLPRSGSASLA